MTQVQPPIAPPQSQGRPGGLTALAVLNFVFGGFGVIGGIVIMATAGVVHSVADSSARQGADTSAAAPAIGLLYLIGLLGLVGAGLLIASGVGYIKQKKVLGFWLGHAYAIVSILGNILGVVLVGLGIGTVIGLAYPVLTLALLNTAFKNSFPNP